MQNEFLYNPDGTIKSELSYKDFKAGLVGSKKTYQYQNGRLASIERATDYSSSSFTVNYTISKTTFDYDNDNNIIQSNNSLKKDNEYEFTSFFTYTYNDKKLLVKVSRYAAGGLLFGYSTYTYDRNDNVTSEENYGIDQSGNPVKQSQQSYQYDDQKNPYRNTSDLAGSIPYSISRNNVTVTTSVYYTLDTQGVTSTLTAKYNAYNAVGYPVSMNYQGNTFVFEYK